MLSEIGVNVEDETFETVLISQALDKDMQAKKVSFKQLKWYFSSGQDPTSVLPD